MMDKLDKTDSQYFTHAVSIDESKNQAAQLIDINELQSDTSPFVAAIEPCQNSAAKNVWSYYTKKPVSQIEFEQKVSENVSLIAEDNPYLNVKEGEVSAIEAIGHKSGSYGLDIRPKIFDGISKSWTLLDSGSCVSCIPKEANDVIDPKLKLRSVNGSAISTYGSKNIAIRIGRKNI